MKKDNQFLKILRELSELERTTERLKELRDEAFKVFDLLTPLKEFDKIFNTSWRSLYNWNNKDLMRPYLHIQRYDILEDAFNGVKRADINRAEFAERLKSSCTGVEEAIKSLELSVTKKRKELDRLYNKFAKETGDAQSIFEEPTIKMLIMDKLLKPLIEENSN